MREDAGHRTQDTGDRSLIPPAERRGLLSTVYCLLCTVYFERAQRRHWHVSLAVEHVVGAEGDHVAARQYMVRAALHHAADVEVVGVEERRDRDAEQVFCADLPAEQAAVAVGSKLG